MSPSSEFTREFLTQPRSVTRLVGTRQAWSRYFFLYGTLAVLWLPQWERWNNLKISQPMRAALIPREQRARVRLTLLLVISFPKWFPPTFHRVSKILFTLLRKFDLWEKSYRIHTGSSNYSFNVMQAIIALKQRNRNRCHFRSILKTSTIPQVLCNTPGLMRIHLLVLEVRWAHHRVTAT